MAIIESELLLKVLRGYNPWWSGQSRDVPSFRRVAFQQCLDGLTDNRIHRAVLLSGPRRVGKSTILLQTAEELIRRGTSARSILYATLDHNILKLAGLESVIELFQEQIWDQSGDAYLLLDEVHYSAGWAEALKVLIDHQPRLRILATGSAALDTSEALSHAGVGRWLTVSIPTLSFYEFLHLLDDAPEGVPHDLRPSDCINLGAADRASLIQAMESTLPKFRDYLLVGGFPETGKLRGNVPMAQRLLREDVVDRVLKRDVADFFRVRGVNELERLFLYVCKYSGGILNVTQTASELGITRPTADNYLDVLVRANLVYRVPPLLAGGKKMLKRKYKYYLVDAALRNAILLSTDSVLEEPEEAGLIVETAILRHLRAFYYADTPDVSYWRGRNDEEVDVVVSSPKYTIAAEVKYRERIRPEDLRGLLAMAAIDRPTRAFLITKRQDDFNTKRDSDTGMDVAMIPAHIFTYLLGQAEQYSH